MADYTPEDVERGADAIHEGDCGCPDGREIDEYVEWSGAVLAATAPAIAARARRAAIEECIRLLENNRDYRGARRLRAIRDREAT